MSRESPGLCPSCQKTAALVERQSRVRRGNVVLDVVLHGWQCTFGCLEPESSRPLRFIDDPLAARNDTDAAAAWLQAFGQRMPDSTGPGRKVSEKREIPLHVMLTPTELQLLDKLRGPASRSEYVRSKALQK